MLLNKELLGEGKSITFSSLKNDKFKASVIAFSVNIPLTKETVAYNLLLSGLLRRGTQKHPSMSALNRSLDELYGSYVEIRSSHISNNLSLIVSAEVLDNKFIPDGTDAMGGVIDIVSDIFLNPLIKSPSFDRTLFLQEQRISIDSLNAEKNNTRAYSIKRCAELMSEGFSLYPTRDELLTLIEKATFEDVLSHYENIICHSPLDIFYIGATSPDTIKAKLRYAFSKYPSTTAYQAIPLNAYRRAKFKSVTETMAVSQGKLAMGFSTGVHISPTDNRYYTALMLNEIFGGSASSKLFLNVREKMSLCYYCSSTFSIYSGVMMVSSGIEVDKLDTVKNAILDQLDQIKLGNISEFEFEAARRSISNSYRQLYDNPFDMQSFYSGRSMFGINDSIDVCRQRLMEVKIEDIISLAKEIRLDAVFFVEGSNTCAQEEDVDND